MKSLGKEFTAFGTKIYYEDIGEGIPVLSIHGWTVDHRLMSACLEPIFKKRSGFRRIYFDLPGMGKSKPAADLKNSDGTLKVICSLIDFLIPGERFILAGESYGGYLARGLLRERPSSILGMLLICPQVKANNKNATVPPVTALEADRDFLATLDAEQRTGFCSFAVVQTEKVYKRFKNEVVEAWLLRDTHFLDNVFDGAFTFDLESPPLKPEQPTLVFLGQQDWVVGFKDQLEVFSHYPRATIAVLDRAGHILQIEQKRLFEAHVEEWLAEFQ